MIKEIEDYILDINDKDILIIINNNFKMISTLKNNNKIELANRKEEEIIKNLKLYFGIDEDINERKLSKGNVKMKKLGVHPSMRRMK